MNAVTTPFCLLRILALVALCCVPFIGKSAENASETNSTPDQTYTTSMVGIWQFSFPDGEQNVRIEMRGDAHWTLWSPSRQTDPSSKRVMQEGTWFVHNRTLFLRIEKVAVGHMPPGLAYSYDFVSVSLDTAVFTWLDGKREVRWQRIHQ